MIAWLPVSSAVIAARLVFACTPETAAPSAEVVAPPIPRPALTIAACDTMSPLCWSQIALDLRMTTDCSSLR